MKPVRFGSWDLGRMGLGRGKTNHIQMTGWIQPNWRLDFFPRRVSFANTSKLVVVCTRFFKNLDQTRRFSVYWKKTTNLELQHRTNRGSPSLQTSWTSSPLGRVGSAQCFIHVWMLQELLSSLPFSHRSPVTTSVSFSNAAICHHCKCHIFFFHTHGPNLRDIWWKTRGSI